VSPGGGILALVADVHGNLPALEAVLADAREMGATTIWNAGDCVGYGAFPSECVALLREACEHSVLGNYDQKVLAFSRRRDKWSRSKHPLKFLAFQFAWENLDPSDRDWLSALPRQVRAKIGGHRILMVHATVLGSDDSVGPHTPSQYWRRCEKLLAAQGPADLVLGGHTHEPYEWSGQSRFVFAGAVGRPEDNDPRAHYTLIDLSGEEISVQNRRVPYDIDRAVTALADRGLPEAFAVMAQRGLDLKRALALLEKKRLGD
jgi:diadenosine tetraphosphatase ApaH/serine/threonine PP2A family protein phosphatase